MGFMIEYIKSVIQKHPAAGSTLIALNQKHIQKELNISNESLKKKGKK